MLAVRLPAKQGFWPSGSVKIDLQETNILGSMIQLSENCSVLTCGIREVKTEHRFV